MRATHLDCNVLLQDRTNDQLLFFWTELHLYKDFMYCHCQRSIQWVHQLHRSTQAMNMHSVVDMPYRGRGDSAIRHFSCDHTREVAL